MVGLSLRTSQNALWLERPTIDTDDDDALVVARLLGSYSWNLLCAPRHSPPTSGQYDHVPRSTHRELLRRRGQRTGAMTTGSPQQTKSSATPTARPHRLTVLLPAPQPADWERERVAGIDGPCVCRSKHSHEFGLDGCDSACRTCNALAKACDNYPQTWVLGRFLGI